MEMAEMAKPVSVLMFDIDHFKSVNDTYGHQSGDDILVELAKRVSGGLRYADMVARYGGEEFVSVLADADPAMAVVVAERLRADIANTPFEIVAGADPLNVTVSIGCASTTDPMETGESLIARADRALYQAKDAGRNCVVSAELGVPTSEKAAAVGE